MLLEIAAGVVATIAIFCGWKANHANFLMWQKKRGIPDYHEMTLTQGGGLDSSGRLIDATRTSMLREIWSKRAWVWGFAAAGLSAVAWLCSHV